MSKRITEQDKDANPITKPETDYQDADGNVPVDADAPIAEPNEEQANSDAQLRMSYFAFHTLIPSSCSRA